MGKHLRPLSFWNRRFDSQQTPQKLGFFLFETSPADKTSRSGGTSVQNCSLIPNNMRRRGSSFRAATPELRCQQDRR